MPLACLAVGWPGEDARRSIGKLLDGRARTPGAPPVNCSVAGRGRPALHGLGS